MTDAQNSFSIACAQVNPTVGDLDGNAKKVLQAAVRARDCGAALLVLPEMVLQGYPAEDWVTRSEFAAASALVFDKLLKELASTAPNLTVVLGAFEATQQSKRFNTLYVVRNGQVIGKKYKTHLPQSGAFDETHVFTSGDDVLVLDICGKRIGFAIGEDLCSDDLTLRMKKAGAQMIISINASIFKCGKRSCREKTVIENACGLPLLYVNMTGGQDEWVFDGNGFAADGAGRIVMRQKAFEEDFTVFAGQSLFTGCEDEVDAQQDRYAELFVALVTAMHDYVKKSGFTDVVLGLSGGVDSALVAAIAVEALGRDHVHALGMPTRFTSELSLTQGRRLADNLGIEFLMRPIDGLFESFMHELSGDFKDLPWNETEENLQARIRGMILMAHSNKFSRLVLATGNKSESAVGYSTLYGDTAGAFAVIKDVLKTDVWELCRYFNRLHGKEIIPQVIIDRPPSAELRDGQTDEATLPPYSILDRVIRLYVEEQRSAEEIVAYGIDREIVRRIVKLIHRNEFKRRQTPIGPKVSGLAFGRDWHYPVVSRFDIR